MDGQTKGNAFNVRREREDRKWDSKEPRQQRASDSSVSVRRYFLNVINKSKYPAKFKNQQNWLFTEEKTFTPALFGGLKATWLMWFHIIRGWTTLICPLTGKDASHLLFRLCCCSYTFWVTCVEGWLFCVTEADGTGKYETVANETKWPELTAV